MERITKYILVSATVLVLIIASFSGGFYLSIHLLQNTILSDIGPHSTTAIELPSNKILLVNYDNKYGAIKILSSGTDRAKVEWWYQILPSTVLVTGNTKHGETKLFEKYKTIETVDNKHQLIDIGSNLYINLDTIRIEWSASNWIYYSEKYGLHLTDIEDIKKVKIEKYYDWTYIKREL